MKKQLYINRKQTFVHVFLWLVFFLNRRLCSWFLLRYTCVHITHTHTENLTCAIDNISLKKGRCWLLVFFLVVYNELYLQLQYNVHVTYILYYSFHVPFPTNFKLFFCFSSCIAFAKYNVEQEQNKMQRKGIQFQV